MKKNLYRMMLALLFMAVGLNVTAQERRPIDAQHPMWMIHIDAWNAADPQKIIDLIPVEVRPFVCMNLSLSCQFDTKTSMYRMPRCAVRTYKSWGSVCQKNGMWFTCQPASGGHTHIQDDDLETFEYFFKAFPNFLGWNYAEQFWGFGEAGDMSSSIEASRWALFAKLVEMSHKYGGFLTVSWCGGIYHFNTDPIAELKLNSNFLNACKNYPEAILFLYKYTHCSSFYNNESVCFGPFISGLTKNYGVRYDNCGWNDMTTKFYLSNHPELNSQYGEDAFKEAGNRKNMSYPGSAGIGTVMEQTCVNGGAVWDGPELIWSGECFQNMNDSKVDGYTRRNWGTFNHFKGIWLDMWKQVINGKLYIPSREEVVAKTKVMLIHDTSGDFKVPDDLYDGLYKQTDPGNFNKGRFEDNLCYFKSTGRYGAIPMSTGVYDDAAKTISVRLRKSGYSSRWSSQSAKVNEFNKLYPEVSKGDLYVNRYRNQLVTYTPYTYMNAKKRASAEIPLQYNTCESLRLNYGKLSSGYIREYSDHIDFYLNNYRSDSTTVQTDSIIVTGVAAEPTYTLTKHSTTGATGYAAVALKNYDAEAKTFALIVKHNGPLEVKLNCSGTAERTATDLLPAEALPLPKQPEPFVGSIVIEAEDMDFNGSANNQRTHSGWWAQDYNEFAGMGFVTFGASSASLRHQLKLDEAGSYDIYIRYCNTSKAGNLTLTMNGTTQKVAVQKVAKRNWCKAKATFSMNSGTNDLRINNNENISMTIDQIIYVPVGMPAEKFLVTVRSSDYGTVVADKQEAAEGDTVRLTVQQAADGYQLKELRIVNSVYYTMSKTIKVTNANNITFVMPDDNVTLQPVFEDVSAIYKLNFTDVQAGTLPPGWRCVQEDNTVHEYPNKYGNGARVFDGFSGHQGKALYWRTGCAEYGRQTAYPLTLQPGKYKVGFSMAAWKGTPTYKVSVLNLTTGKALATSSVFTATPNANGVGTADLSSAQNRELEFTVTEAGKYVVRFAEATGGGGMIEFLLLECRVVPVTTAGIDIVSAPATSSMPAGIYSLSGVRLSTMQRGINIVVSADGSVRRVMMNN